MKLLKFKAGDRVKCVDVDGTPFTKGEVLTVEFTLTDEDQHYMHLSGTSGGWFCERFVLVGTFKGNIK